MGGDRENSECAVTANDLIGIKESAGIIKIKGSGGGNGFAGSESTGYYDAGKHDELRSIRVNSKLSATDSGNGGSGFDVELGLTGQTYDLVPDFAGGELKADFGYYAVFIVLLNFRVGQQAESGARIKVGDRAVRKVKDGGGSGRGSDDGTRTYGVAVRGGLAVRKFVTNPEEYDPEKILAAD
ncbi:MAG: hypothetical protein V1880_00815 [Patescibacteria group bacterium]